MVDLNHQTFHDNLKESIEIVKFFAQNANLNWKSNLTNLTNYNDINLFYYGINSFFILIRNPDIQFKVNVINFNEARENQIINFLGDWITTKIDYFSFIEDFQVFYNHEVTVREELAKITGSSLRERITSPQTGGQFKFGSAQLLNLNMRENESVINRPAIIRMDNIHNFNIQ